jgi:hypothetical protein
MQLHYIIKKYEDAINERNKQQTDPKRIAAAMKLRELLLIKNVGLKLFQQEVNALKIDYPNRALGNMLNELSLHMHNPEDLPVKREMQEMP